MVSQKVYNLCHADKTVSSEYARDPTQAPSSIHNHLYGRNREIVHEHDYSHHSQASEKDLKTAYECGNWGSSKPSKLFLQVRSFRSNCNIDTEAEFSYSDLPRCTLYTGVGSSGGHGISTTHGKSRSRASDHNLVAPRHKPPHVQLYCEGREGSVSCYQLLDGLRGITIDSKFVQGAV